jgi:transposase
MAGKRRKFSAQFKVDAVMELLTGAKTKSEICRERKITEQLLYRWKNELLERLPNVFEQGKTGQDESASRIAELERMVGRLALENEILKNAENWRETHRRKNGR